MRFRDFILKEAASASKAPTFVRGSMPYASGQLAPEPQYGVGPDQVLYADLQWKQRIHLHIIHLRDAKKIINIGGQEVIPQFEIRQYHIKAIEFLVQEGILSERPESLPGYNLEYDELMKLQNLSDSGQAVAEAINTMFQNRDIINDSNAWGVTQKYHIVASLLDQYAAQACQQAQQQGLQAVPQQGIAELMQNGVLADEPILVHRINTKIAEDAVQKQFHRNKMLNVAHQAGQSMLRSTATIDNAVAQTAPR